MAEDPTREVMQELRDEVTRFDHIRCLPCGSERAALIEACRSRIDKLIDQAVLQGERPEPYVDNDNETQDFKEA